MPNRLGPFLLRPSRMLWHSLHSERNTSLPAEGLPAKAGRGPTIGPSRSTAAARSGRNSLVTWNSRSVAAGPLEHHAGGDEEGVEIRRIGGRRARRSAEDVRTAAVEPREAEPAGGQLEIGGGGPRVVLTERCPVQAEQVASGGRIARRTIAQRIA